MINKRSILAWAMALLTAFLVSCGSAKVPPTYSDADFQQIEQYTAGIVELRDRMDELENSIQNRDWVDVGTFIHGPLGSLGYKTNYLTQSLLLSKDKKPVLDAAKKVFADLEEIDAASKEGDYSKAIAEYKETVGDFDAYLDLIPKSS